MVDMYLDLSALPNANPAVPESGWINSIGSNVGQIRNGFGYFGIGGSAYSGWTYNSALTVDGSGDYVVDITVFTASTHIDSYNARISILNSSGEGYALTQEPFVRRLHRINSGGISGSVTDLTHSDGEMSKNDVFTLKYNPTTGLLRAFKNGTQILSTTDTTFSAVEMFGGFAGNGFVNFTSIKNVNVYNVAAAPTLIITTPLTPGASRTDTCAGFSDGAAAISFGGVSVPVTIVSGSFTYTVPMLADGVVWPRLPATGQTITLTQGVKTTTTTANINLPTGHQTLRVGDVIGGAVANFASIVTDNDRMLGYHFVAAANPLATTKTAYFTTANSYWVYRNGDVGASTYVDGTEDDPTPVPALPRTDTLYIQEANGLISAHEVTLTAAGVVTEDTTPNSFTFTAETGANINTGYTSNQITISGLGTGVAATLTVTNGTYSKNGGVFTSTADVISNGDTLRVRGTSSANYSTAVTVSVTVGTYTTSYSITTKVDNEPDNINFVTLSALSNIETVEGVTGSVPISITGGQYSKNSGAFTSTAGTVVNTDTIQLSAANGATVIVTIGSKTFSWSSVGSGTSGIKRSIIHAIK